MSLYNPMAGIFPVLSYLHVPGKMAKPLWLMMGSCFMVAPPTERIRQRAPITFLTSAHTFLPWHFVKDPKELKIPDEFRRPRYVVARLFMFDEHGAVLSGQWFPLTFSAVNKDRDMALLTMAPRDYDAFVTAAKSRGLLKEFALMKEPLFDGSVTITGYRAQGMLGTLDTLDPGAMKGFSKEQQEALLKEMEHPEGKQEATTCGMKTTDVRGIGVLTHGRAYNGMSGAPVLPTADGGRGADCCGILAGHAEGRPRGHISFVPSDDVLQWCDSLFQ